jgi:hypothetical protein
MSTDVGFVQHTPDGYPHCLKCNKPVDEWAWEAPCEVRWRVAATRCIMRPTLVHTGEIIITITCHGEIWKASNWRGRLE